jgi:SAM-dependent methyltransferase
MVLGRLRIPEPGMIVEYGCGFGNATLPILQIYPQSKVMASDISPNLLAILHRLLPPRGLAPRCVPVAMDALKPYVREGVADLVFGAAILHHLIRPEKFVASAMRVLRPGGIAFFFEPLEGGHAVLLQIIGEVLREAARRAEWNHPLYCLDRLAENLRPQIFRGGECWSERDDKWAFARSKLDDMADAAGAEASVIPLHDHVGQFRRHLTYMLETYVLVNRNDVPAWIWDIVDRYDQSTFSAEMLRDLSLEGCVVFRKRG